MLAKRIIPCLDVHAGRVTRGQQFGRAELGELADVGDPVALALHYNAEGADELVLYDITATSEGRGNILDVAARVAERCFMPLTIGGGVRELADVRALTLAGADKVSVNSAAVADPELVRRAADAFGSQAIVLSIDVKRGAGGGWEVYVAGGRRATGLEMTAWAERGQALGAGEIVLNSIDGDGMGSGYDLAALRALRAAVDVPIVASGGAGSAEDMRDALLTGVDAALAAGIFHRGEVSIGAVKRVCREAGLPVREVAA
ncbi:MAG: imidazole glycerol phosphate synthase subunit HisF [Trueperaceae bacterium]|nr:imidazole glycerol phosphate synthase subunit HisF [Trueperaceae bacterium]